MLTPSSTASSPNIEANYRLGYIWTISVVAALGGLLFGYDWVVIGGAKPFFEPFFGIQKDSFLSGWANSCALLGCLLGSIGGGVLTDRLGRKWLLSAAAILFVVTSLGNALAPNFDLFILWRILGGTAIGLASNLSPLYISEIAPAKMRGRLVAINQLTIVVGILLAQVVNWWLGRNLPDLSNLSPDAVREWISTSWYGVTCWRWMFGLTAVPAAFFFLGMFFVPESPRWLVKNGRHTTARQVLGKLGDESYASAALADIEATLVNETEKVNFGELFHPRMMRVLALGVMLAVLQQWCGINVIFNYAENIFHAAGYDISNVLKNIAWTGSVNLLFTFVALGVVDHLGRRPLMLLGELGLAAIYIVLGAGFLWHWTGWPMLVLVLAAIGCYAMTLAPCAWVIISEIFPNRIRGAAMAVAVSALWIACFALTYTFPWLEGHLGPAGVFWLYGGICAAAFAYFFVSLPETKGKTLEDIERELVD